MPLPILLAHPLALLIAVLLDAGTFAMIEWGH
jgi:hypothetical protein